MREIDQDLNSLLDNLMALLAANAGNKADATGVVLERWIVETLRRRQSVICLPTVQKISPKRKRRPWFSDFEPGRINRLDLFGTGRVRECGPSEQTRTQS